MPLELNGIKSGSANCECDSAEGGIARLGIFCFTDLVSAALDANGQITGLTMQAAVPTTPSLYVSEYTPDTYSETARANENPQIISACNVQQNVDIFGRFVGISNSGILEMNRLKKMNQPVAVVEYNSGLVRAFGIDVIEKNGVFSYKYAIQSLVIQTASLSDVSNAESRFEMTITGRLRNHAPAVDTATLTMDAIIAL